MAHRFYNSLRLLSQNDIFNLDNEFSSHVRIKRILPKHFFHPPYFILVLSVPKNYSICEVFILMCFLNKLHYIFLLSFMYIIPFLLVYGLIIISDLVQPYRLRLYNL